MKSTFLLVLAFFFASSQSFAQGLDGLYLQMQFAFGNFQEGHYFFLRDGRYLQDVPEGSLTPDGLEKACAKPSAQCGKYSLNAANLVITPFKGKPETLSLERLPQGDLKIDGVFAKRAPSFPSGTKLSGNYSRAGTAGPVSAARSYHFRADGTFSGSALGGVATRQTVEKSESSASGTYRLTGNVLELVANGKTSQMVVYPYDLGNGDVRLNINGVFYKK